MKLSLIAILFCFTVYGQSVKVNQTDSDSLWQDFKFMYEDITKPSYWVTVQDNKVIFYNEFACDMKDIDLTVTEKINKRLDKNK